jgi:hypothetical protein
VHLAAEGFEIEADVLVACVHKGPRMTVIPIRYSAREGRTKLSSFRDGVRMGAFLCKK